MSPLTRVGYVKRHRRQGKPYGNYFGFYRFEDGVEQRVNLGVRDKRIAERKLAERIAQDHAVREGLAPSSEQMDRARRPLSEYIDEYIKDAHKRNLSTETIRKMKQRITDLCAACGWECAADISTESFRNWRDERSDLAPKTTNHYLDETSAFVEEMLVRPEVLSRNPLIRVRRSRIIQARPRRPLSIDEFQRLIRACPSEKRRMIYRIAAGTGARTSEMKNLLWSDLKRLDSDDPVIHFRAEITKNGRSTQNPIPFWLARRLLEYKPENASGDDLIFPQWIGSMCFDQDLARAEIDKLDARGRTACLYSMRHAFNQNLEAAGVPMRKAQKFMRHLNIEHTATTYMDPDLIELRSHIDMVPDLEDPECTARSTVGWGEGCHSLASVDDVKNKNDAHESSMAVAERRLLSSVVVECPSCGFECRRGDSNPRKTGVEGASGGSCTVGCTADQHEGLCVVAEAWPRLSEDQREAVLIIVRQSTPDDQSGGVQ